MDVRRFEIPVELAALLRLAEGQRYVHTNRITEVAPPEIVAHINLSLPQDLNNFPFSKFVSSHFQVTSFPACEQPLQQPLTRLESEYKQHALDIYKLILRFVGDSDLQDWQEVVLGNYIAQQGIANLGLRNEILSQMVSQTLQNPLEQQCQRAWLLMTMLLGSFTPSLVLEKPLLKYVSDYGLEGFRAVCQHKILRARQQTVNNPETCRTHPPTLLEWKANERKGKMVLDVFTFNEEKYLTEVDSWTTGEQFAAWVLKSRGLEELPRGWSVSVLTGEKWHDLTGCDFVLDLVAEVEEGCEPFDNFSSCHVMPDWNEASPPSPSFDMIPPAPGIQAPPLPPPFAAPSSPDTDDMPVLNGGQRFPFSSTNKYIDDLFEPVLPSGHGGLDRAGMLNARMKGGGKIGPTYQGAFSPAGFPAMGQGPAYQTMPVMGGMMPATMPAMSSVPMMPTMGGVATMPAMMMPQPQPQPLLPAVDPTQLAVQQQAFINQQALLLAQQMTLQASVLSQQQQQQQQQQRQLQQQTLDPPRPTQVSTYAPPPAPAPAPAPPPAPAPAPAPAPPPAPAPAPPPAPAIAPAPISKPNGVTKTQRPVIKPKPAVESQQPVYPPISSVNEDPVLDAEYSHQRDTFQQKRDFFQKIGQQENEVKASRSKILLPQGMSELNKEKEEEEPEQNDNPEPVAKPETVSVPPPKPPVQKPVVPSKPKPKQEKTNLVKSLQPPSRPEPSQEIRNIIKMYQTRPAIEPQPLQPIRKPPNYLFKKNDPKDEALLRLGILDPTNGDIPPASSTKNNRSVTPTQSIREKQLPLLNIFATHPQPPGISSTSPTPPPPPPPPPTLAPTHPPSSIPPPPDSQAPVLQETDLRDCARLMPDDGNIKSFLCKLTASVYFSYANINWKIFLRKEVFYPREKFTQPYCLNLLCEQIMRDTYSDSCFRVSKEEKRKMKDLLMEFQIRTDARSIKDEGLKKRIVMTARDNWANYFSRFFPVTGENGSDVQLLGVSHRGIRLLKVVKASGLSPVHLKILCSYSYADMLSLAVKSPHILEFSLRNEQLILHSPKARQLKAIVDVFLEELRKDSNYVIALRSYITDDKSILQFKKGDLIKLLPMDGLDSGWQFGSVDGRSGLFPSNIVQAAAAPDYLSHQMNRNDGHKKSIGTPPVPTSVKESPTPSEASEVTNTEVSADANQYTMVEFAMKYFREALIMLGWKGMSAERKNPSILVQHTKVPIQESLIYYTDPELNEAAPHSFMSLMRFMGDQSSPKSSKEVDHVYHILQLCKEKENLRDEIYCQVIKQITENPKQESCSRGWLLFDLLSGFFLPSSTLLPYITKYLQEISSSPGSGCQDLANACQKNLRQTTLYGGRCHLPFTVEMEALLKGNHTRRILIKLPGNIDYGTKIKTFTVGAEVLKEFCEQVGVYEPQEIHEFSIFANKSNGEVIRPIRAEEYVHDFLLDDNSVTLELRRITWKLPLHFENDIFTDMHYYQTCQTYLNGKMLLQNQSMKQVGTLAALQLWAKGLASAPSKEDLLKSIPVPLQNANLQTIGQHVNEDLRLMQKLTPREAKIHFIETVMQFAFFDYNIYSVKRISEQGVPSPCLLGVNQQQIIVADSVSQKLYCSIPLVEVQTMRTLRPMDSATLQGVEINYGSPDNPKTMWFELEQAKEVYHTIALIMQELDSGSHV